ncbi:Splicing factor 3B subunit 6 Pre-mRNA branch site protein p14 SF3b 14 kDa subunit [Larimichthys crocea]|uniref:Splicing factor 3B subunit 6 n=1 Tax=Larimichthys crocea TaxID=215358 RepID=A0A6G0I768_LARCR|nr:Splicing factor 3B subunit 6 Pre-mRNA branch site protein p14 SF3b 14 kDa subunit [Larimichthys crocea]
MMTTTKTSCGQEQQKVHNYQEDEPPLPRPGSTQGLQEKVLADMFDISVSTVSRIVITWANYLYQLLGSLPIWMSKQQVQETMPIKFAQYCPEIRLPPEVNRILYVRNLPYKITAEEMYDIFGKYGPIRQIRTGNTPETRGTAYVVYEDIFDAKNACDHLSGFNVCNRYLVVLYYNANRAFQKMDTKKKEEQLKLLKEKYGINTDPPK